MLKKRIALFGIILFLLVLSFVNAQIFQDDELGDFLQGNFSRTFYNSSGFVQLNISQGFTTGNFSSRVFDAGINSTWNNISWTSELCYGCELVGNGAIEQGNFLRLLNMSGNILLAHMNEQSGNITDSSGNLNHGNPRLFEGNEYGLAGKFNTSIDFENGVGSNGEYINFTTPSLINSLENQLTLEAWIKPESFPNDPTIIDKGPSLLSLYVSSGANNLLTFILDTSSGGATSYTADTDMSPGEWYHVVATYNGSQVRLYLNGELDSTPSARTGTVSTNNLDLVVGSGWSGANPNAFPFDGLIDEVAIYNRSLNAQEISDRYARGVLRLNLSSRVCNDQACSGESYSYISGSSPQNINSVSDRYFQYNFEFTTENTEFTPRLYNVSIDYLTANAPPSINITYPLNNTNYTLLQSNLNFSAIDSDLDSCWYTLDLGQTNNSAICGSNITSLTSNQGINIWRVYANDTTGETVSSTTSFFIDSLGPNISIINPLNNSLLTNRTVRVNYTIFDSGVGLSRCWWTNSSGSINNTVTCGSNFTFTGSEGNNFVRIYSNDTFGNLNSQTNTFLINTQAPSVNIVYPATSSVVGNQTGIALNFSVIDPALNACWYTLTEGFVNTTTPSICQNTTFSVNGDGVYEVFVYANDSTGNIGFDSNTFIVSVNPPSVDLVNPIETYFGNASSQKINFTYEPQDWDLQSCRLWTNTTGVFMVNQTNNTINSDNQNYFFLNLSNHNEGAYSWSVSCNDTLGHNYMADNQTFYIDRTKPNVTLSEPAGTYSSLSNIPITVSYTDLSPVQCYYNVTFAATGNTVIANTELPSCSSTTFTLDTESSYFFYMSLIDSAGNTNTTRKSFTVSVPSGGSSGGSSGGGSSGGGGGGGGGGSVSLRQSFSAELGNIEKLKIRRGESESIELPVKNNGLRFLNSCFFTKGAGVSEWISGNDVYSLSPGETTNYIFSVNAPIDAEIGDYFTTLGINCQEINASFTYQIEVIGGEFELNIINSERIGAELRVNYAIENFGSAPKDLNINYKLVNSNNEIVSEGSFGQITVEASNTESFEANFDLPKNSIGDYVLIIEASDNLDVSQKQQAVRFTTGGISGFAISDNNLRTVAWFGIVILIVFGMFIVIKVIRNQVALRRASQENERQFITIDLK